MKKYITPKFPLYRFFFCILLIAKIDFSVSAQTVPTFVILPFGTESSLIELRNNIIDTMISRIKSTGYNAVGTRYLTSVLKMETCSTFSCMEKIALLVGARYVINGSLSGDSITFNLSLEIFDVSEKKRLHTTEKMLVGGLQAASLFATELVATISEITTNHGKITTPAILPIDEEKKDIEQVPTAQPASEPEPVDSSTDTFNFDITQSSSQTVEHQQTVNEEQSIVLPPSLPNNPEQIPLTENTNIDSINKSEELKKETLKSDSIKLPPVLVEAFTPPPLKRKILFKSLPSRLDQQNFRGLRLLAFGNLAVVGGIAGLVLNDKVSQSLKKEIELYEEHLKAGKNQLKSTYYNYSRQTEKTDDYIKIRNALYTASGVCAAGFAISIAF